MDSKNKTYYVPGCIKNNYQRLPTEKFGDLKKLQRAQKAAKQNGDYQITFAQLQMRVL